MARDFQVGEWLVQPDLNQVSSGGKSVQVEPRVIEVLVFLAEHPGEVLSKEKILGAVWPNTFVTDEVLTYSVSELRKALGDDAKNPRIIQTIPRRGYRIIAPVIHPEQSPQPAAPLEVSQPIAEKTDSPHHEPATPTKRVSKRGWLWGLLAAALLATVALLLVGRFSSAPERVVLAVLPFENLSADPEQEFFSDGLTEEMISQLGRLQPEQLRIIARTSAMQYKRTQKRIDQIGRELGANYILEGTVRHEGGQVRVTAQLIQVSDQTHIWAETYDRELSGILDVQNEVARALVQKIRLTVSQKEQSRLAGKRPVVPEAHLAYLKGRFLWNKRTPRDMEKSIDYFEEAIKSDPLYAPAYAGVADALILLNEYSDLPPLKAFPRARIAAEKALKIDPDLAEAHASMAMLKFCQDWDWQGAEEQFRHAISLNPSYVTAHHWYSNLLSTVGRYDDAEAEIRRAIETDTFSPTARTALAWRVYASARRYDQATQELTQLIGFDPNYGMAHRRLGICYILQGRYEEGLAEVRSGIPSVDPGPLALADLGHALAVVGRKSEAVAVLKELQQFSEKYYVDAARIALIHVGLGEKDQALSQLQKAYEQRDVGLVVLRADPRYDPLRDDPRFRELLRKMRLQE